MFLCIQVFFLYFVQALSKKKIMCWYDNGGGLIKSIKTSTHLNG